jgi:3-oxoacyl-[acyl-carrier-protein] synthase II
MEGSSIDYLSGAGNSSKVLDALEAKGVKKAFQTQSLQIPVSSIKSMTGEAIASGGMRMVADVLSMENSFIPPTIHYRNPDPTCDLHYVINQKLDREIKTFLHLGISPDNCFSSFLVGVEWNG